MSSSRLAVVTGAAGFIGSHLVDLLLARGYKVHAIDNLVSGSLQNLEQHADNPQFVFKKQDLRDTPPDDPLFNEADYLFHFAGIGDIVPSIERPTEYLSANVMGTVHALEIARHAGVRKFVYAASSSCYGLATELPTGESAPIR